MVCSAAVDEISKDEASENQYTENRATDGCSESIEAADKQNDSQAAVNQTNAQGKNAKSEPEPEKVLMQIEILSVLQDENEDQEQYHCIMFSLKDGPFYRYQ